MTHSHHVFAMMDPVYIGSCLFLRNRWQNQENMGPAGFEPATSAV